MKNFKKLIMNTKHILILVIFVFVLSFIINYLKLQEGFREGNTGQSSTGKTAANTAAANTANTAAANTAAGTKAIADAKAAVAKMGAPPKVAPPKASAPAVAFKIKMVKDGGNLFFRPNTYKLDPNSSTVMTVGFIENTILPFQKKTYFLIDNNTKNYQLSNNTDNAGSSTNEAPTPSNIVSKRYLMATFSNDTDFGSDFFIFRLNDTSGKMINLIANSSTNSCNMKDSNLTVNTINTKLPELKTYSIGSMFIANSNIFFKKGA
jgi:hypothetical protein